MLPTLMKTIVNAPTLAIKYCRYQCWYCC